MKTLLLELDAQELKVLLALHYISQGEHGEQGEQRAKEFITSYAKIAKVSNICVNTVIKGVKALIIKGYISRETLAIRGVSHSQFTLIKSLPQGKEVAV